MRHFTQPTNTLSKKFESHIYMVALYTLCYGFIHTHKISRVMPAMAANSSKTVWDMKGLVRIMDGKPRNPVSMVPTKQAVNSK